MGYNVSRRIIRRKEINIYQNAINENLSWAVRSSVFVLILAFGSHIQTLLSCLGPTDALILFLLLHFSYNHTQLPRKFILLTNKSFLLQLFIHKPSPLFLGDFWQVRTPWNGSCTSSLVLKSVDKCKLSPSLSLSIMFLSLSLSLFCFSFSLYCCLFQFSHINCVLTIWDRL